ncbi:DUF1254 domain-containing protein [Rhizobium sp. C1]|uniref:DUF1254 domain-containing protein n=1 Tax=Rhizobium sp. C1 TaxID=1349799 RepID=UPI001E535CF6|nr:DUF1254 domain-containing protein [Rhizobium sp. C1]MCD2177465.1 DUF1254 domain-containing protein [Rhizobium sp. C1]
MRSLFYAIGVGLLGALVLHITVILATPVYTGADIYARVLDLGADGEFRPLPETSKDGGLAVSGPFLKEAVCAFSVDDGPVNLTAEGKVPFWSAAIYDSRSNEIFSMSDRTSVRGTMDIIAGTEAQITALKNSGAGTSENHIFVTMPAQDGYVVLRTVMPETSMATSAQDFLDSATCDGL